MIITWLSRVTGHDCYDLAFSLGGPDVDHTLSSAACDTILVNSGLLAESIHRNGQHLFVAVNSRDAYHVVAFPQSDPAHSPCSPAHIPDLALVEADRLPIPSGKENSLLSVGKFDCNQLVSVIHPHSDNPVRADIGEFRELRLLDHALARHHDCEAALNKFTHRNYARYLLTTGEIDQVDDGFAAAGRADIRNLMDPELVDLAARCKDHEVAVSRGDEDVRYHILGPGAHTTPAGATAAAGRDRWSPAFASHSLNG